MVAAGHDSTQPGNVPEGPATSTPRKSSAACTPPVTPQIRRRAGVAPIPMTTTEQNAELATEAVAKDVTDDHLQRLVKLGTATVYEAQGQRGSLASEIRPILPGLKLVGTALTVSTTPCDNLMLHKQFSWRSRVMSLWLTPRDSRAPAPGVMS